MTLGLGIGASTAIYSVVDGILLQEMPFEDPDELVTVWADYTGRGGPLREWLSYENFADARALDRVFDDLGVYQDPVWTLTGLGEAEQVQVSAVTYGVLERVLRVSPVAGRSFQPEDDEPNAPPVTLVSHDFWQSRLGGTEDALGDAVTLNDVPYTVVGVSRPDSDNRTSRKRICGC